MELFFGFYHYLFTHEHIHIWNFMESYSETNLVQGKGVKCIIPT